VLTEKKTISEMLLRVYELPREGDFFKHIQTMFEGYIPSLVSGYSFFYLDSSRLKKQAIKNRSGVVLPDLDELSRLVVTHPFVGHYRSNTGGAVLHTTDVISLEAWRETELYNALWYPNGLLHDTSVRFYFQSTCCSFVFTDSQEMSTDSHRLLEFIAPHLGNAHRAFRAQQKILVEGFPCKVILLSAAGCVTECSVEACTLLDHYYPHKKKTVQWRLPSVVECWVQSEIKTLTTFEGNSVGEKLIARRGRNVLSLRLLKSNGGFMILFDESVSVRMFDVLLGLGLTQREAEVLQWICHGKQNSEVAQILQVSVATVRKHVEHILQKLYCETRGAAAQLAIQTVNEHVSGIVPEKCSTCTRPVCLFC